MVTAKPFDIEIKRNNILVGGARTQGDGSLEVYCDGKTAKYNNVIHLISQLKDCKLFFNGKK